MKIQKCTQHPYQKISIAITAEERLRAKEIAKAKGMTFQGWLASLVKHELEKEEERA